MKAVVVYDTFFGNTKAVAETIAKALGGDAYNVSEIREDLIRDTDFLIVGSPTRAFSATKDILSFVKHIKPAVLKDKKVAVFDTRMDVSKSGSKVLMFFAKRFGYAADIIKKTFAKKGVSAEAAGFFVENSEGPLSEDELTRADEWIKAL